MAESTTRRPEIVFSDEEALLLRDASDLFASHSDFESVRKWIDDEAGYDRGLYARIAELGYLGLSLPMGYGGSELPCGTLAPLAEAMGRHLHASPFLSSTLAGRALLFAGTDAQKSRWLPELAAGQAIGTLALTEPSGSAKLRAPAARAERSSTGIVLAGTKTFVLDALHAHFVLASALLDGAPALFLIERDQLAGRMRREVIIDQTRRSARITLDGLVLGPDALLAGERDASAALDHVERVALLLFSAEMSGGAEGVFQLTLEYLKTRVQFGRTIGSYQHLKHGMVEILCAIEQGRSLLYHAATAFDRDDASAEIALRMAKAQLGETFTHAADRSIQFHGAIGFTHECHAQLFFKRAQWLEHAFGNARYQRQRLAPLLLDRA